jgi:DNA-binding MarR family transcriptional regulator
LIVTPKIAVQKIMAPKIAAPKIAAPEIAAPDVIATNTEIPQDILRDSVLAHVAAAYFSVGKRLERKTRCSATRGFILSTLRSGATLNQNQIALRLGFDRTVVHRAVKSMVQEGLVSERKAESGRAIPITLTPKGHKYGKRLINARIAADNQLRKEMTPEERTTLLRLLKLIAELEF